MQPESGLDDSPPSSNPEDLLEVIESMGPAHSTEADEEIVRAMPEATFSSSEHTLILPSSLPILIRARLIAVVLLIVCSSGVINGVDFTQPDSGLYKHRDIIYNYAKNADPGTAILTGRVLYHDGTPAVGWIVEPADQTTPGVLTDSNGSFKLESLDPGIVWVRTHNGTRGQRYVFLLSGPAGFEPYGFTRFDIQLNHPDAWNASLDSEPNVNYLEPEPSQIRQMPYDEGATQLYIFAGYCFIMISVIGFVLALLGGRSGDPGMLRTSCAFAFLTLGYYGTGCLMGVILWLSTIGLPSRH
ncbi:MAG TPA: carboxypeptidase-like regulatory domain-containing protein [Candidatus Poseidoniales archaeon]|nr:carboxypeptidase-like regulatory domain-containing protein [Candidatus Poseidoniales archaeon]